MKHRNYIIGYVLLACLCMELVDGVLRPGYAAKSAVKLLLFGGLPWLLFLRGRALRALFTPKRMGLRPLLLGLGVYAMILLLYSGASLVFDFSQVTGALQSDLGVGADNFVFVSLYISFVNSLLEEFFFRGLAFLQLKRLISRRFAYGFSALTFAGYHIAMMTGWFDWRLLAPIIAGLALAGVLFNRLDEKGESLFSSWFVHMFANFAINTIGFHLMGLI